MSSEWPILIAHLLELRDYSSLEAAQVNAGRKVDMLNAFHDEFNLFPQRLIFLAVHSVLIDKVNHNNLACLHCISYLFFLLFALYLAINDELFELLLAQLLNYSMQFGLFSVPPLCISLFFHFGIIKIPLHLGKFFLILLSSAFVRLRAFFFVEGELLHTFLEDINQRIFYLPHRRLLFQHYNILISFIRITKGQRLLAVKLKSTYAECHFYVTSQKASKQLSLVVLFPKKIKEIDVLPRTPSQIPSKKMQERMLGCKGRTNSSSSLINIIIFIIFEREMFDQFYCNEQNSLDLLLKFSTQSDNPDHHFDYHFDSTEKEMPSTDHNICSLIDLFNPPVQQTDNDIEKEVTQMKVAAEAQENKIKNLLHNKNKDRPKMQICIKRKASECTEAPTSPLRKTKTVRKEKS